MQENLGADKVDGCTAEYEHHFRQKYQPDEANILTSNTCIHNSLGKEWENKLQERTKQ